MGYRTLFEGPGIHHSESGYQITHDICIKAILCYSLISHKRGVSEGHISHPEQGNISLELKFAKPLPEAITCLLYLEFDNSILIGFPATSRPTSKIDVNRADTVYYVQYKFIP